VDEFNEIGGGQSFDARASIIAGCQAVSKADLMSKKATAD
jgi:hypothetical protein